jgi:hypothetical protein
VVDAVHGAHPAKLETAGFEEASGVADRQGVRPDDELERPVLSTERHRAGELQVERDRR